MSREIKNGDIVTVTGQAWSRFLVGGSVGGRVSRNYPDGRVRKFKVLAVDCKIPVADGFNANTLIMDVHNGRLCPADIVAINACNLQHYMSIRVLIQFIAAGTDVTNKMSKESKEAVLRAHLDC